MNIGDVAKRADLPAKTIRYYEEIGLVTPPLRDANGYRSFRESDIHRLAFIGRARRWASPSRNAAGCSRSGAIRIAAAPMCGRSRASIWWRSSARSRICKRSVRH